MSPLHFRFSHAWLLLTLVSEAWSGQGPSRLQEAVDAAVRSAYESAAAQFPCKVKTRGKPKILRWEEVDRCLNDAATRVDWEGLGRQIANLRDGNPGVSPDDFSSMLESSLSAHALPYDRVLSIKDEETLLPLTNSLLKFLPADSLQNLPVFDKVGTRLGTFLGTYQFERSGGLASANKYRLALFQYTDRSGNVQPVGEKLLLDSFGVPWKEARTQRGFRLLSEKLFPPSKHE